MRAIALGTVEASALSDLLRRVDVEALLLACMCLSQRREEALIVPRYDRDRFLKLAIDALEGRIEEVAGLLPRRIVHAFHQEKDTYDPECLFAPLAVLASHTRRTGGTLPEELHPIVADIVQFGATRATLPDARVIWQAIPAAIRQGQLLTTYTPVKGQTWFASPPASSALLAGLDGWLFVDLVEDRTLAADHVVGLVRAWESPSRLTPPLRERVVTSLRTLGSAATDAIERALRSGPSARPETDTFLADVSRELRVAL